MRDLYEVMPRNTQLRSYIYVVIHLLSIVYYSPLCFLFPIPPVGWGNSQWGIVISRSEK